MSSNLPPLPPEELPRDLIENESGSEFSVGPPQFSHTRIPEDVQVPWGVWDLVLFVLVAIVATLAIGFIVGVGFILAGVSIPEISQPGREQSLVSIVAQGAIDFTLLGYLALHIRIKFQQPFWRTIGWRPLGTGILPRRLGYAALVMAGVAISFLVDAATNLHPPKGKLPIDAIFQDRLTSFLFLAMAVLLAPVVEETIFRGYLYPVIAKSWGALAGILITGVLFGALHGFQLGGAPWQITLLVIVGIVFTWVRAKAGTVVASYCMHVGYNSFLLAGFLVSTHFLRSMPSH